MKLTRLLWLLAILSLGGCAAAPRHDTIDQHEVAGLAHAILALGEGIDPEEARRAAQIAYGHSRQLAREYQITDPPLIHNTKVNMGLRPRGLCYHWSEDIEARLLQEDFRTLDMHRAIAPARLLQIEHSTAIISRKGDSLFQGLILDPWRTGGELFWTPVRDDTGYNWRPRDEVLDQRRQTVTERRQSPALLP